MTTMYNKYRRGEVNAKEYKDYLAQNIGFKDSKEYTKSLANKNGFATFSEYQNYLAQKRGFRSSTEYARHNEHKRGIVKPLSERKECGAYLGVYIAENILSKIFEDVKRMPYGFPGYDFICKKGYKIDVKTSCLKRHKNNNLSNWHFVINNNKCCDYFLLLAFDNRNDLNPMHMWLIKGRDYVQTEKTKSMLCEKSTFRIYNKQFTIDLFDKYEVKDKLIKLVDCCDSNKSDILY